MKEYEVTFKIKIDDKCKELYPNYLSNEHRYYKITEMCNYYQTECPQYEDQSVGFIESIVHSIATPKTIPDPLNGKDSNVYDRWGYEIKLIKLKQK